MSQTYKTVGDHLKSAKERTSMAENETIDAQGTVQTDQIVEESNEGQQSNGNEEIAKMRAELAKMKTALDNATKEAGTYRKQLRAKQSEEEIAAEEKKAAEEAVQQKIAELEKEVARTHTIKSVMGRLKTDEEISGKIADYMYGAEDAEAALTEIQRAWDAREKALRLEFGKIPPPGVGGTNGEDAAVVRARNIGKEKAEANNKAQEAMKAYMR